MPKRQAKLHPVYLREFLSDPSLWLRALIVFVPVAIALALIRADPTLVFITSALGIIPLASILGEATDVLAIHVGARLGALLNATFGNAAELIITIAAIRAGLLQVVKASITGSIIGNILLVLGLSVLAGGLKNGFQHFGRRHVTISMTMMVIAVIGLFVPAVFNGAVSQDSRLSVEYLSVGVAVALIVGYVLGLIFSFTAAGMKERIADESGPLGVSVTKDKEQVDWSQRQALLVLAVCVVLIAVLSEILVDAIEPVVLEHGLTELFVGVIIVPIIGNAAEHIVSVEMAMQNKMDLALGIALGSSTQVALFVAPLLVFISLAASQPMDLIFTSLELVALGASVLVAERIVLDGESNWLEGAELIIVYVILALAFFYLPA
jgi:Ca2+:H+ antiporter